MAPMDKYTRLVGGAVMACPIFTVEALHNQWFISLFFLSLKKKDIPVQIANGVTLR